ncbi:MAG: signal protein [Actinomycetota bacterium]
MSVVRPPMFVAVVIVAAVLVSACSSAEVDEITPEALDGSTTVSTPNGEADQLAESTTTTSGARSNAELAAAWWTWAAQEPATTNPVVDADGSDCARNQPGDVWFLAGSFGEVIQRSCTVPAGTELFAPVLNSFCEPDGCGGSFDDAERLATLDGVPLEIIEIDVPSTTISGQPDNAVFGEGGTFTVMVAGWWIRVPGLAPGKYELRVAGDDGSFRLDVTYDLTVE